MRLVLCAVYLFIAALVLAIPNMTRRDLLFAVPVPPDFRDSRAGRHAISTFRAIIAVAMVAGVCALLLSPGKLLNATMAAAWLAIFLTGGISFYWQNRRLAVAAVQFRRIREVELTATPEELPRFAWLAAGPLMILGATAGFLYLNWSRTPGRFPIHWGAGGQPDRWVERTLPSSLGPYLPSLRIDDEMSACQTTDGLLIPPEVLVRLPNRGYLA